MEDDALTEKIDTELMTLQSTLKDRLKETNDLADLNQTVFKSSMQLEKHTAQLESTARETKWKWFLKYAKWMAIAFVLISLLVLVVVRPLLK